MPCQCHAMCYRSHNTPMRRAMAAMRNKKNCFLRKASRYHHCWLDNSQLRFHICPCQCLLNWDENNIKKYGRILTSGSIAQSNCVWEHLKGFYLVTKNCYLTLIMSVPTTNSVVASQTSSGVTYIYHPQAVKMDAMV